MSGVVEEWRRSMLRVGRSPNTIRKRVPLVRRYLASVGDPWAAGPEDVWAWLDTTAMSSDSKSQAISCLHAFYKWAIRAELTKVDPTLAMERPKLKFRLPRPTPEQDYLLAVTVIEDPLIRAWVLLAGQCGLRCIELGRLEWADVDLERRRARVLGKGDRERIVPLPAMVVEHLRDMPRGGPYLVGARPSSGASVSTRFNKALHEVGITSTAHQLRHRAGTEAQRATGNLRRTQRFMGHATSRTTELYTLVDDEEVLELGDLIPPPGQGGRPRAA